MNDFSRSVSDDYVLKMDISYTEDESEKSEESGEHSFQTEDTDFLSSLHAVLSPALYLT